MQETEYSVGFELMNGCIVSSPSIENRDPYPFGEDEFNRFFQTFFDKSFKFAGDFRCIFIFDAKENAPNHSYAIGWMFAEDVDQLNNYLGRGEIPKVLGEIRFEYGGGIDTPRIIIEKRQRILRRFQLWQNAKVVKEKADVRAARVVAETAQLKLALCATETANAQFATVKVFNQNNQNKIREIYESLIQ